MSTDPTNDLIHAVREGRCLRNSMETAKTLIATSGLCSSDEWSNGYDLLCEALRNKHVMMAELLLKSGCSVNPKNNQLADTPLHLAVANSYLEIISMLLDREANINAKTVLNKTPLHIAVSLTSSKAKCDTVKLLLEKVVNIEAPDKSNETILNRRADVNARLGNGCTPLHIAVGDNSRYSALVAKLLIRHGANIEATDEFGCTPLHFAIKHEDMWVAQKLLEYGANVEAKDKFGRTALHYAAQYNRFGPYGIPDQMIRLLLNFNADPNATCKNSLIPLECAKHFSDLLYKQVLVSKSLDLPVKESVFKKFFNNRYQTVFEGMKRDVAAMKTFKIGDSNATYYDFLTCGTKQLAVYARTESIVESLKKDLGKHVHIFSPHLTIFNRRLKTVEKIQKKQSLLRPSLKSLRVLSGHVLPDLPALEICEYLTIGEMERLIKAVSTVD